MTTPICPECYRLGTGHSEFSEHTTVPTKGGECPLCGYVGESVTQDQIDMTILSPTTFLGPLNDPKPNPGYEGEYDAV